MARGGKTSTSFKPGEVRNPRGRPKVVAEIKELARLHTKDAMDALVSIVKDLEAPPAARVSAASVILDRGYGKPGQHVEHSGSISLASLIEDSLGQPAKDDVHGVHPTVQ